MTRKLDQITIINCEITYLLRTFPSLFQYQFYYHLIDRSPHFAFLKKHLISTLNKTPFVVIVLFLTFNIYFHGYLAVTNVFKINKRGSRTVSTGSVSTDMPRQVCLLFSVLDMFNRSWQKLLKIDTENNRSTNAEYILAGPFPTEIYMLKKPTMKKLERSSLRFLIADSSRHLQTSSRLFRIHPLSRNLLKFRFMCWVNVLVTLKI